MARRRNRSRFGRGKNPGKTSGKGAGKAGSDASLCDRTTGGAVSWVERCPNGRWRAAYRDPSGRKRSRTFDTKAAVKAFSPG